VTKVLRRIIVYRTRSWLHGTGGMLGDAVYTAGVKQEFCAALDNDPWPTSPAETDPEYYRTWQKVSVAIQRAMRRWALEIFLRKPERCEDREWAMALIVYASSRPFYGRSKTEFTWDAAETGAMERSLKGIGTPIQRALFRVNGRLKEIGREELACRYAPVWYLDVLLAARRRPTPLVGMLAREAKLIEAVIGWGTERNEASALRFVRVSNWALRRFQGMDMREVAAGVLKEVTESMERSRRLMRVKEFG